MSDIVERLRDYINDTEDCLLRKQAADEIESLRRQLAEARKDTTRLDWLELNHRNAEIVVDGKSQPCLYYAVAGVFGVRLREIIDAAIAMQEGKR